MSDLQRTWKFVGNNWELCGQVGCQQQQVEVFEYTGADQQAIAPSWATTAFVQAWGGGGGVNYNDGTNNPAESAGGAGGYAEATFDADAFDIVIVGGGGETAVNSGTAGGVGGFGGGGKGGDGRVGGNGDVGGGGGGLSGVFSGAGIVTFDSAGQSRALLAAGGGGGGGGINNTDGSWTPEAGLGGGGGGEVGEDAGDIGTNRNGKGGTQIAGGVGGSGGGQDGSALLGGQGENVGSDQDGAGGGGGGYFGGGGGASSGESERGGGGGSGYVAPTGISPSLITAISENPPNTTDDNYVPGVAIGGRGFNVAGNGLVVITWYADPGNVQRTWKFVGNNWELCGETGCSGNIQRTWKYTNGQWVPCGQLGCE